MQLLKLVSTTKSEIPLVRKLPFARFSQFDRWTSAWYGSRPEGPAVCLAQAKRLGNGPNQRKKGQRSAYLSFRNTQTTGPSALRSLWDRFPRRSAWARQTAGPSGRKPYQTLCYSLEGHFQTRSSKQWKRQEIFPGLFITWRTGLILILVSLFTMMCGSAAHAESTHRLYDGITAFIPNADGRDFAITLTVRDINLYENGPREILCKVYDPDGHAVVRRIIADDGVKSKSYLPPIGAWDHEAWYYAYCYMQGTQPMIRWSAYSEPDRLASVAKRTFRLPIKGGKKGVYRLLLVGCNDHYVTIHVDPDLPYAVSGQTDWLHGHGDSWRKSYVYVPRGAKGLHVMFAEYDLPRSRRLKISAADGKVIHEATAKGAFTAESLAFEKSMDDQLLTVEVSEGKGDFLLGLKLRFDRDPEVKQRGEPAITAALAPDRATAKAVRNGAIYHDGRVFWHPFQIRFHDWLKKLPEDAFVVKDADGKVVAPAPELAKKGKKPTASLPGVPNFISLNGPYWRPTMCDRIMHHYRAHHNRQALNVALKDLHAGLRSIGPNDHVAVAVGGQFANMGYEFSNYAWHYWRPAWRILKEPDTPKDVKKIVQEAFLVAGDRLAFCRTWSRVNGNSFAQVVSALRYCSEGTGDPIHKKLFETYRQRFTEGGWGDRVGIGPSGPVQEGFAYAYHYGSYILTTWQSVLTDLPDERMQKTYDRIRTWYSYTLADERVAAGPWSARTHHYPHWQPEKDGPFAWKGLPGSDFTVDINDGHEFFAARRQNYYALTYHGRLSPKWECNAHYGQSGFGGGMLCQLQVPGAGIVLASTLNGDYGEGMDISQWRNFHLHTLAGIEANGSSFVAGDSEHVNAQLKKNVVTSSGPIRNSTLSCERSFTFDKTGIACSVQLKKSDYDDLLGLWLKNKLRGKVKEAYETIPFVPQQIRRPKTKPQPTLVTLIDANGKAVGALTEKAQTASTVVIDRGGFGVRVVLPRPYQVSRGQNNTVQIHLTDDLTAAENIALQYRLEPFRNKK